MHSSEKFENVQWNETNSSETNEKIQNEKSNQFAFSEQRI